MKIEIISIGNEVLRGQTLNTNSTYLSSEFVKLGLKVYRHQVIEDNTQAIEKAIVDAFSFNDITIFTGGLGPTLDDITKECISKVLKAPQHLDPLLKEELIQRWGSNLPSLQNQATYPQGMTILKNILGTAPGLLHIDNGKLIAFLPGVPYEMKEIFQKELLSYILKKNQDFLLLHRKTLHFVNLVEVSVDPILRELKKEYPSIEMGIYPALGHLTICLEDKDKQMLEAPYNKLKDAFKTHFFESPTGRIQEAILEKFIAQKKTLGLAESCTGGSIAKILTSVPKASNYLKGSIVSYSNEVKENVLKVKKETLDTHGAVSKETVIEMAQGALTLLDTDVALSVSGIAGPDGGSKDKPVGTVWACIAFRNGSYFAWQFFLKGNREMIIEQTLYETLGVLNSKL